ncbi:dephospho-CoA kinase [Desulfopila sp. IMCC35008]|uniref:dephospho-CoA kinase n=1 Tax=Desulfopila sp. IMCC35008 TaxID=2653858 RepID=UPI0013D45E84|nr:dephospho-CoA kinase [Desulfopila sp. IMCC35008]
MNIAVTGNIGSGKSGVTSLLAGMLCAEAVDADEICSELLLPGNQGCIALESRWGARFFTVQGELDKRLLRQTVFSTPQIREELEKILHPLVQDRVRQLMGEADFEGAFLIAEIPLLFEVGWAERFDRVITVYAPEDVCRSRVISRDGVSSAHVDSILALQMNPELKAEKGDYVINNAGTWSSTVLQTAVVVRSLGGG